MSDRTPEDYERALRAVLAISMGNDAIAMSSVDVLCQCGWGRLSVPEAEVPAHCPVCGYQFIANDDPPQDREEENV